MKRFTCILPIHNRITLNFAKRSLDSIVNQTLPANEILVYYDGIVNKDVDEYVKTCANNNRNVKQIGNSKNEGLGQALNRALHYTKYDHVVRMDADDFSLPNRFEQLIRFYHDENLDLCGSYITEVVQNARHVRKVPLIYKDLQKIGMFRTPMNHVSVVMNRNLVNKVGGYKTCFYAEDWYLWLRIFNVSKRVQNIPISLVDVDVDGYQRRSGLKTLSYDLKYLNKFFREGLIPLHWHVFNILTRICTRILPRSAVAMCYKNLLRSKGE
ncbi:glycosyltransferase [Verrucomicrobia bacterium]|nr:glycosyltransferase [Verrucomicrobiota bacterium]